jgi:hypothetical protein
MQVEDVWDGDVVDCMIVHGGAFVAALGRAYLVADPENVRRLDQAFPEYWDQYREIARRRRQVRREAWGDP